MTVALAIILQAGICAPIFCQEPVTPTVAAITPLGMIPGKVREAAMIQPGSEEFCPICPEGSCPPQLPEEELKCREAIYQWIGGESKVAELECDFCDAKQAALAALEREGILPESIGTMGIIDFTKPSYLRRLLLFNPATGAESLHLVAHGKNSGTVTAERFSNRVGSLQSSLGLYWVGEKYRGCHGDSLRLHGMEAGVNDKAYVRAIVLHSAWYVSYSYLANSLKKYKTPQLGLSHGCPTVHCVDLQLVLSKLVEGSYLYIYKAPPAEPAAPAPATTVTEAPVEPPPVVDPSLVF